MPIFRYRVLTVSLAVLLVFSCLFMFLIPRVSATMVYSPYDITTYFIIMSGGTSEAAGSSYGYYYNGAYNTSSTTISSNMYASYSDMYNSQLQAFWQYNQSAYGPQLGVSDGYTTYLDYIDACMQEAVYNSNNNSYMSYYYDSNNILQAHYEINPMTAELMFEFFKWQNVIDLGGSGINATDFDQSMGNVGVGVNFGQYGLYKSVFSFNNSHTTLNNSFYTDDPDVYLFIYYGNADETNISKIGMISFDPDKTRSYYYVNGSVHNINLSTNLINGLHWTGIYTISNISINSAVYIPPPLSTVVPYQVTSALNSLSSSDLFSTDMAYTSGGVGGGNNNLNFQWLQDYLDAVDASLDPDYVGDPPAKPVISYDLTGTGASSTDTDTVTSTAIVTDLMQNGGGDNISVDTMYDDPPGGGDDDDPGEDEDEFKDVIIPLFNLPLPSFDFSLSGIWYYVVRWVQSMSSWMSTMFGLWGILPPAMVYPIWGTAVVVIVIGIYRRFFM